MRKPPALEYPTWKLLPTLCPQHEEPNLNAHLGSHSAPAHQDTLLGWRQWLMEFDLLLYPWQQNIGRGLNLGKALQTTTLPFTLLTKCGLSLKISVYECIKYILIKPVVCEMLQCKLIIGIQLVSQSEKIIFTLEIHPWPNLREFLVAFSGKCSLMEDPHTRGSFKLTGNSFWNLSSVAL